MNRSKLIILFVLVIIIFPTAAYIYQFGIGFWEKPEEWSSLGGYIGGIYAPILTLLTLTILSVQIYLQVIQHRQSLVLQQEQQLDDYLKEINLELDKIFDEDLSLRTYLNALLRDHDLNSIGTMNGSIIFEINEQHHKVYSMWCGAMYCLKAIKGYSILKNMESTHYIVQKNRIIAYLNPQVCRTLDKFNYALVKKMNDEGIEIASDVSQYEFWNVSSGT
jgi:uncharacterized membrane protein